MTQPSTSEITSLWTSLDNTNKYIEELEKRILQLETASSRAPVIARPQMAPSPDYTSDREPERCGCEEVVALRAELRIARELVPRISRSWHSRVADLLRGT